MYKQYANSVLWDIDKNKIDTLPKDFVIKRILSYGTVGIVIEMIKEYGFSCVKKIFLGMKSTSMPKRKYDYFKNYLFI